jgi:membrane protein
MRSNPEEGARSQGRGGSGERAGSTGRAQRFSRRGWWDILKRVGGGIAEKNLSLIAAGAAFYAFLAIPSAFAALVSLYGLAFNPANVRQQVLAMVGIVPDAAITLVANELMGLTTQSTQSLGLGFLVSVVIALWSAKSGMTSIMSALNIAYDETEKRGLLLYYATAFTLTATVVLFSVVALALIAVLPAVIALLPFPGFDRIVASIVRWPILVVLLFLVLAVLFRYAPSHAVPKWRWISWGSLAAALLWLAGSALFSLYISAFALFSRTYGPLGAVVALLMWLYLSAYAVLIGARLDAEIERNRRAPVE